LELAHLFIHYFLLKRETEEIAESRIVTVKLSRHMNRGFVKAGNSYSRGRLSTVDLLINEGCLSKQQNIASV
jgi:hypothetical protein